jgi:hypothetical protein
VIYDRGQAAVTAQCAGHSAELLIAHTTLPNPMVGLNEAIEKARMEMSSDVIPRAEYDRVCAELESTRLGLVELGKRHNERGAELERLRSARPDPLATEWPCRFEGAMPATKCAHVTCRPLP